jgi:WD40 repeat protein
VSSDQRIRSWNVPYGQLRAEGTLDDAENPFALSPDGQLLVARKNGEDGADLTVFSLTNGHPVRLQSWPTKISVLESLCFSSDGRTLFAGGIYTQAVQRYDLSDPSNPRRLPDVEDSDGPLTVSPDGQWLATALPDEQGVRLRALPSLMPVGTNACAFGESQVNVLQFTPDSRILAIGLKSGRIILWRPEKPAAESVTLLGHEGDATRLAFSHDGQTLASASILDKTVRLWDVPARERGEWTFQLGGSGQDVNFSPDSKRLVTVSKVAATSVTNGLDQALVLRLWRVDDREGIVSLEAFTNTTRSLNFCACFSPDGSVLAVDDYGKLQFLEVPTLTVITQAGARLPRFGPDGRWLVYVGGHEGQILRTDSPSQPAKVFVTQKGSTDALGLSRYGSILASSAEFDDHLIRLWNALTGQPLGSLRGHQARVNWLAFSPDGKTLASAGWDDGKLGIWDVARRRGQLLRAHNGTVFKLAFSPDGTTLATCGDGASIRLWNVAEKREVAVFPVPGSAVNGVAFSPDGHWLACASSDGAIHLWWAPSRPEIEDGEAREANR